MFQSLDFSSILQQKNIIYFKIEILGTNSFICRRILNVKFNYLGQKSTRTDTNISNFYNLSKVFSALGSVIMLAALIHM